MVRSKVLLFLGLATSALLAPLFPREAHAAFLDKCGGISIEGQTRCEFVTSGGCDVQCTPVSVQAACIGELRASCEGECKADASVSCTGSCQGSCEGQCDANPGSFDCKGTCQLDCEGSCDATCASANDKTQCKASCSATCGADCSARCEAVAPSATCEGRCQGCCSGSCTAQANLSCQVNCQARGYAECEVNVQGGCQAACKRPEGALFCNGQYVETGDIEACVQQIESYFNIKVEGHAECSNGQCSAEGSVSCAAAPGGGTSLDYATLGALGVVAGVVVTRRRRRKG